MHVSFLDLSENHWLKIDGGAMQIGSRLLRLSFSCLTGMKRLGESPLLR